jgi:hypothetical protein
LFHSCAFGHHAGRCLAPYSHKTRRFPKWFIAFNPSSDVQRKLSQAIAIADYKAIGDIVYLFVFEKGWIGRDQLTDELKRWKAECAHFDEPEEGVTNEEKKEYALTYNKIDDDDGELANMLESG